MSRNFIIYFVLCVVLVFRIFAYFDAPSPFKEGDRIKITAIIRSEPIRYETSQYLKLYGLKTYLPLYPIITYGDKVVVEGIVREGRLEKPQLKSIENTKGFIFQLRNRMLDFYAETMASPYAGLIEGMTIGSKSGMPGYLWDILKNSGTAHIVVASGMNISLVAGFLMGVFTIFFKRKKALVFAIVGIWFYAVFSGFEAPIVRSAIMGTIAFSAQEFGRLNASLRALLISGVLMLLVNPGYITDVGFLLSFFATLGLILFEKRIRKKISFVPSFFREDLSTTLAAQIGVFPILITVFGKFNILSPIVNLLILWTVVPVTVIGIIGGLIGLLVPVAGRMLLYLAYPFVWWFVVVVSFFG